MKPTTRPMTKSPRRVMRAALEIACDALPAYSCPTSRHDFTQHQLFAILALKTFLKTDYRGVVAFLDDLPELRAELRLAKAAYDAEDNHATARDWYEVRTTVIPLNRRGHGRKWPRTKYRRQMVRRFRKKPKGSRHKRVYGQRWQAESVFSRNKRLLGAALRARSEESRERECLLRVLTHNLMLLAATEN